jgi:hypothetical protein
MIAAWLHSWLPVLHDWQDLVGGIIGAIAVTSTVWWTLRAERRRHEREATALRTALGAEVRQFAVRALDGHIKLCGVLTRARPGPDVVAISAQEIEDTARFPEPAVYPQTAAGLGVLGKYAYNIVHFFGQVTLVRDVLRNAAQTADPRSVVTPRDYLINCAEGLLKAAEAATRALPAFEKIGEDERYGKVVSEARQSFNALVSKQKGAGAPAS